CLPLSSPTNPRPLLPPLFPNHADIDSADINNDLQLFGGVMTALERASPDATVFVLVHKMDLVAEQDRDREFEQRSQLIRSKTAQ
ncbi:hypothetical protein EON65_39275, partial [archaeon]